MHRDVKPHNVLVGHDGYLALTDFGLSAVLSADRETRREAPITNKCGTRGFWAPEVVQKLPQAEPADWWSLGVTLHMCATGTNPFRPETPADGSAAGESPAGLTREAEYNEKTMHSPIEPPEESLGPELTSLLLGLLTRQELSRLGSAPGGALSVKGHAFFRGVEWELLRAKRLPAPFLPDRNLVYCKDVIGHSDADEWRPGNGPPREEPPSAPPQQQQQGALAEELPMELPQQHQQDGDGRDTMIDDGEWRFVPERSHLALELAEAARRVGAADLFKAPLTVQEV